MAKIRRIPKVIWREIPKEGWTQIGLARWDEVDTSNVGVTAHPSYGEADLSRTRRIRGVEHRAWPGPFDQVLVWRIGVGEVLALDKERRIVDFGPNIDLWPYSMGWHIHPFDRVMGYSALGLETPTETLGVEVSPVWVSLGLPRTLRLLPGTGRWEGWCVVLPDSVWDALLPVFKEGFILVPDLLDSRHIPGNLRAFPALNGRYITGDICTGDGEDHIRWAPAEPVGDGGWPAAIAWQQPRLASLRMGGIMTKELCYLGRVEYLMPLEETRRRMQRLGEMMTSAVEEGWSPAQKMDLLSQSLELEVGALVVGRWSVAKKWWAGRWAMKGAWNLAMTFAVPSRAKPGSDQWIWFVPTEPVAVFKTQVHTYGPGSSTCHRTLYRLLRTGLGTLIRTHDGRDGPEVWEDHYKWRAGAEPVVQGLGSVYMPGKQLVAVRLVRWEHSSDDHREGRWLGDVLAGSPYGLEKDWMERWMERFLPLPEAWYHQAQLTLNSLIRLRDTLGTTRYQDLVGKDLNDLVMEEDREEIARKAWALYLRALRWRAKVLQAEGVEVERVNPRCYTTPEWLVNDVRRKIENAAREWGKKQWARLRDKSWEAVLAQR